MKLLCLSTRCRGQLYTHRVYLKEQSHDSTMSMMSVLGVPDTTSTMSEQGVQSTRSMMSVQNVQLRFSTI